MREVQNAGFGDYSCRKLRGPRRRGVRTAAGDRAARRAEVSTPPVILICEQGIDSEVSGFLHRCSCRSKTNKKTPENKPTWSFAAAHLCRASQRRWRSQTRACSLLRRFRKVDSTGVPLGPSKTLQIIHVSHFSARPGEQKATEQQRCARRPSPPLRGCCAGIGCCPSCTGGPLIS